MTALTVAMEVWAANDRNPVTETWTEALTNYIPAPILLAVVAWFATWLVQHFRESAQKKAEREAQADAAVAQEISSLSALRRYKHGQ